MVEFAVALIVIMVLLAGLIQIGQLCFAHTQTMANARAAAARAALSESYSHPWGAEYIYAWLPGGDAKRYTRDDIPAIATNTVAVNHDLLALAQPAQLRILAPDNPLSAAAAAADNLDAFFLVKGRDTQYCPTLQAIRKLIYDQDSIAVVSEACLVWTEGIY